MNDAENRIPVALNLVIAAALVAANLLVVVALAVWLLPRDPAWGWLLVLPVASTPPLWSLIHEAVHGALSPSRVWNERLGRLLSIMFGSPFQVLRLGHLLHHRYNRTHLNRMEVTPASPRGREWVAYYSRLCGGLYVAELSAAIFAILPERFRRPLIAVVFGDESPDGRVMLAQARRALLDEPGRSRMRLDGAVITVGLTAAFIAFGSHAWMLLAALAGRAFLVSFHDNAYHYANPLDDRLAGEDLRLPRPLQAMLLNFNLHATHHRKPNLPWNALPAAFAKRGGRYGDDFARAALRQLHGPLPENALPRAPATGGAGLSRSAEGRSTG